MLQQLLLQRDLVFCGNRQGGHEVGCSQVPVTRLLGRIALLSSAGAPSPRGSLHANIAELPKVLIKGRNWRIFSRSGSGDDTVHKMHALSLVAVQGPQMDGQVLDLDPGTENKAGERRSDIGTAVPIE